MYFVLIFDADNTLWDTNSVFHEAHVAMLEVFEAVELFANAPRQVERLRVIDRALIQRAGCYEYGFQHLAMAVALHYRHGISPVTAAAQALERGVQSLDATLRLTIDQAYQTHVEALAQIPPLFPGVLDLLGHLRTYRTSRPHLATLMFSEGHPERLERTITAHQIRQQGYFTEIIIALKTPEAFVHVGEVGRQRLTLPVGPEVVTVMIGDSMQRDIRFANAAGFITVYIPGGFEGRQVPHTALDHPDFYLESLFELPSILASLGLTLPWPGDQGNPGHLCRPSG